MYRHLLVYKNVKSILYWITCDCQDFIKRKSRNLFSNSTLNYLCSKSNIEIQNDFVYRNSNLSAKKKYTAIARSYNPIIFSVLKV